MIEFFRLGKTFKILKSSCDPYSLCLGIFPCRTWLFQPVCITEDVLSQARSQGREAEWLCLRPQSCCHGHGQHYLVISTGACPWVIWRISSWTWILMEWSEICWLSSVTLFHVWVHLCMGSVMDSSVFMTMQRCFSALCWLSTNSSTTTTNPIQPTPFNSSFTSGARDSGSTEG